MEGEERERDGRKKSFIPCDDKGLSQSRLIACSSPLRPSSYPFAVATNFDSCFAYATFPTLLRHPFLPSLDLVHPRALDPFTTELSQFPHFVLTVALQLSPPTSSFPLLEKQDLILLPMCINSSIEIEMRKLPRVQL